jgi:UDP-N-acetylglucosamine 4-epimerase
MPIFLVGPMGLKLLDYVILMFFGRKQDPQGAYAAVIPKFVMQLMNLESPQINGDGNYSRDFTYIDNVIQMNELAMLTRKGSDKYSLQYCLW